MMRIIEIDDELYRYIAGHTQFIGENASDILRRLLNLPKAQPADQLSLIQGNKNETVVEKNKDLLDLLQEKILVTQKLSQKHIQHVQNKLQEVIASEAFQDSSKGVTRFLMLLSVLYRTNPESFAQAMEEEAFQGRTRRYFARDEATLLLAGSHTKPKQIPDTPFWVITNTNSGRKMIMLERIMEFMQLPTDFIESVKPYFQVNEGK